MQRAVLKNVELWNIMEKTDGKREAEIVGEYAGKYFSVLGDSLSTLAGYNPEECAVFYDWEQKYISGVYTPSDTWWGRVIETLGGQLLVNHSFAGSTVTRHPSCQIPSYGCSDARTGALSRGEQMPDVVMVLLGLNDYGCHMRVMPEAGEADLTVFSVAYETMLRKLQKNYPRTEVWCMTLPVSFCSRDEQIVRPMGASLEEYCQAIRQCAAKTGCRIVEIHCPQRPYDTIDGYHPTAWGMATIAEAVLRALAEGTEEGVRQE